MAEHLGMDIGLKVNLSQIERANKLVDGLYNKFKKLDRPVSGSPIPSSLPHQISNAERLTASYISRLESEGKTYKATQMSAKMYEEQLNKLTGRQRSLESEMQKNSGTWQKNSNLYRNQKIRINENQTAINGLKSKIGSLNESMKNAVNESYIKRLEANSNTYEVNKLKVQSYTQAIKRLESEQKTLESELSKIASINGKASAEYAEQKIKINQTATAVGNLKSKVGSLNSEMKSQRFSFFDNLKSRLRGTNEEGQKTHSIFKSMFSANLASSAVMGVFNAIKSGIGGLIGVGRQYNEEQQTMNATWLTLTGNASKGKAMVDQINEMALSAQNSTAMVDQLSQQFYAINKDAQQTGQLTKSVLTLQDAFGKSDEAVENFGVQFSQMMANGKVSAQDMMSFVNVFPELRMQLLKTERQQTHNSKLTMKQMNDLMSKGKISSKTMIEVTNTLANNYKNATGNFTKTVPGMMRVIKANGQRLASALEEPFEKIKNPIIGAVSKWIGSKETLTQFNKLGKTMSNGVSKVITSLFGGGEKKPKADSKRTINLKNDLSYMNGLQSTINKLPKEQQAQVKEQMKHISFKDVKGMSRSQMKQQPLPWENPLAKGKGNNASGSKVYTTDLAKQLVFWKSKTEAEKADAKQASTNAEVQYKLKEATDNLNNGLKTIFDGISKHGKDIKDIGGDLLSIAGTIGKDVWNDFSSIVTNIGKAFHIVGKNSKGSSDPIHVIAQALNKLAGNETALKAISGAIVAMATVKTMKAVTSPIIDLIGSAHRGAGNVTALIKGLSGKGIDFTKWVKMTKLQKKLFNFGGSTRNVFSKMKSLGGRAVSAFSSGFKKLKGSKLLNGLTSGIKGGAKRAGKTLVESFKKSAKGLGSAGKSVGKLAVKGFKRVGSDFADAGKFAGRKLNKGFHNTVNFMKGLPSKIANISKKLAGKATSAGKALGRAISKGYNSSVKFTKGLFTQKGGAGKLNGSLQSMRSAGGFKNLTTAGKVTTGLAGAGVALDAGGQALEAVQNIHSADKRSKAVGGAVGTALGGGIGLALGGPVGAMIGAQLGKSAGRWGGDAVNKFTKGWQSKKPPKNFWSLENMGYSAHNMWKGFKSGVSGVLTWFKKNWKEISVYFQNPIAGAFNSLYKHNKKFHKWVDGLVKGFKKAWNGIGKWFGGIGRGIQKAWHGMTSWFGKLGHNMANGLKSAWHGVTGFFSGIGSGIQKAWNGMTSWFGKIGDGMAKGLKGAWHGVTGFFSDIAKGVKGAWDGVVGFFQNIWDKIKNIVQPIVEAGKAVGGFIGNIAGGKGKKHYATGTVGEIKKPTQAILNDGNDSPATANHEAIVHANGKLEEVHGRNVEKPLEKGAQVINAHNFAKIKKQNAVKSVKPHFANGTKSINGAISKLGGNHFTTINNNYTTKNNTQNTQNLKKTVRNTTDSYKQITNKSTKSLKQLNKINTSTWKKINSITSKQVKKTKDNTIDDYTSMRKKVDKQMDAMQDGVTTTADNTAKGFGKALSKMTDYARSAMKGTITQLNNGISGIDKTLSQFGGNGQVIKPIHFATGSGGQLPNDTVAMVNDATTGPRQEAIIRGNDVLIPHGDNVVVPLKRGDQVLNGHQTKKLANSWGLPHFKKGSGVSDSALEKMVDNGIKDPQKSFNNLFTNNVKEKEPDIQKGMTSIGKNSGQKFGIPWMKAMWQVISDLIGNGKGGTREAFLKYAEKTFTGVPYRMAAASKKLSDCSGMVMQALAHFGIDIGRTTVAMQESSGVQYLGKDLSKTVPGDLVIYGHGTGAAGHVGIIKNPREHTMFNETEPHAMVSSIDTPKSMGYGYYRVKGLHNASEEKGNKADPRLMKLAKQELGSKAIKWISNNLGDSGSIGGNVSGDGVQRWGGTVKKVLGMLHLSTSNAMVNKVLRQIATESHGDPHITQPGADPDGDGSGPAMGLMQTKRGTFNAYKRPGDTGGIFNGPSNLYAGLNYAKHRYGPSLYYLGNGHGYAKGGNPPLGQVSLVGENGPELVRFNQPARIYSNKETNKKLEKLASKKIETNNNINTLKEASKPDKAETSLLDKIKGSIKIPEFKRPASQKPTINININGNVGDTKEADKIIEKIERRMASLFEGIDGDYGTDGTIY